MGKQLSQIILAMCLCFCCKVYIILGKPRFGQFIWQPIAGCAALVVPMRCSSGVSFPSVIYVVTATKSNNFNKVSEVEVIFFRSLRGYMYVYICFYICLNLLFCMFGYAIQLVNPLVYVHACLDLIVDPLLFSTLVVKGRFLACTFPGALYGFIVSPLNKFTLLRNIVAPSPRA